MRNLPVRDVSRRTSTVTPDTSVVPSETVVSPTTVAGFVADDGVRTSSRTYRPALRRGVLKDPSGATSIGTEENDISPIPLLQHQHGSFRSKLMRVHHTAPDDMTARVVDA